MTASERDDRSVHAAATEALELVADGARVGHPDGRMDTLRRTGD